MSDAWPHEADRRRRACEAIGVGRASAVVRARWSEPMRASMATGPGDRAPPIFPRRPTGV